MTFNTDSGRLKRILINLIGNSMKFTFKGFVKINVCLVKVLGKDAIKFSISDTGVGMSKED
jgi:signal transduction histidine kinase